MNILQVSTTEHGGGAAQIPWDLHHAYRELGHQSVLAVGYLRGPHKINPYLFEIPNDRFRSRWSRLWYMMPAYLQRHRLRGETRLRNALIPIAEPIRASSRAAGFEDFDFPASRKLLDLIPICPDVVHCHNLHGDYFDLRGLVELSQRAPTILTLHDMWLLTGHCAHSFECERWRAGCGACPDLSIYPAIKHDATSENWKTKQSIFTRSQLYVCAPCQWLIDKARQSMLKAREYRVIPYGINLTIFRRESQQKARLMLGLPADAQILLFVARRAQENIFKDYMTIERAIDLVAQSTNSRNVVFISLGGRKDRSDQIGKCHVYHYAFHGENKDVARFYQASDVFLHAARADTYPITVLEAQACGVPVVATRVGGIPEQVQDETTGFLVARGDADAMAYRTLQLLEDDDLRQRMAAVAAITARERFDLRRQVSDYVSWYEEIVSQRTRVSHD